MGSAHAETFNPDDRPVTAEADFPTFGYEGLPIVCDTGTAQGTTGRDSDRITDIALEFFGNCGVAGVIPATVDCDGIVTLVAQEDRPPGGTGTLELNPDLVCGPPSGTLSFTAEWHIGPADLTIDP